MSASSRLAAGANGPTIVFAFASEICDEKTGRMATDVAVPPAGGFVVKHSINVFFNSLV